ncbi:MAG: hypothetical protein R3F49_23205 [Planctomycetota bacterium]
MIRTQALHWSRLALASLGLLLSTACSESHAKIVAPYVAELDALRGRLAVLAALLPPPGSVHDSAARVLEPALRLDTEERGGNAEAVMFEQLADPEVDELPLDLHLARSLTTALAWTSVGRREDGNTGGDAGFMRELLESARSLRYVIVHRVVAKEYPVALDRKNFKGGWAEVEGVVFDLTDDSIVATYAFRAMSPPDVEFMAKGEDDRLAAMERFAWSGVYEAAREAAATKLRELTGATVRIE